jgi:hypothetical protein
VTSGVTAGSSSAGISTLELETSAGPEILSLFRRSSRSHRP